jgi:tetratricopeptide (TPR) repeat protein
MYLGAVHAFHAFDWSRAERHFLRAIELKPGLADAHLYYAAFVLGPAGRFAEAEQHQLVAHGLDPLSAVVINATGMLRLMLRQYDASAAAFRAALEVDSHYPWAHRGLGEIALIRGRHAEALAALERIEMPAPAAGLIGDERFGRLVQSMGLEPAEVQRIPLARAPHRGTTPAVPCR